jgi:hypothetical protein
MKTKTILLGTFLCLFHYHLCATEKQKTDENIINYFQKSDGLLATRIAGLAFCVPEVAFVLQNDSTFSKFWAWKSDYLNYLKNDSKDVYLTQLLQIKFLENSLTKYYATNEDVAIKRFIDTLNSIPEYHLQKEDLYLFFKSFTDESGVGATKIETLLVTQNLDVVFNYIENNDDAKERFLEWINEDIEVWCPSVGSDNRTLNMRIVKYLYERLTNHNSPLAQQAAKKMKSWFEYL